MQLTGGLITLITDFGTRDPFVGQMKGVMYSINPDVRIVDVTHDITPFNIREAAIVTGLSYSHFPTRSVHLVVVDPGVGSSRRPVIVTTENHYFVGPDNGVFSMIYTLEEKSLTVTHITADHYFYQKESPTFQGRDYYAPVAAWLSKGIPVSNFGEPIQDYIRMRIPVPERPTRNTLEGEVIHIDRFGNAITNIRESLLNAGGAGKDTRVILKGKEVSMKNHYSEAEDKDLYCLINSFGLLEFFVYRGNAAGLHEINIGDIVGIIFS
jgi:hypothetical protein